MRRRQLITLFLWVELQNHHHKSDTNHSLHWLFTVIVSSFKATPTTDSRVWDSHTGHTVLLSTAYSSSRNTFRDKPTYQRMQSYSLQLDILGTSFCRACPASGSLRQWRQRLSWTIGLLSEASHCASPSRQTWTWHSSDPDVVRPSRSSTERCR